MIRRADGAPDFFVICAIQQPWQIDRSLADQMKDKTDSWPHWEIDPIPICPICR
jgi:hypothetical protein